MPFGFSAAISFAGVSCGRSTPMSTKAPNAVTFVTMPGSFMPGFRSFIVWTSAEN